MVIFWQFLLDLVFPRKCVVCGEWETDLCKSCFVGLQRRLVNLRKKSAFDGFICLYDYRDKNVQEVIGAIKFDFNRRLIPVLLSEMERLPQIDVIVPVPLYWRRFNWRGFNQAEEMAKHLSKSFNLPCKSLLGRIRNTPQQARIKDKRVRIKNLKNAFIMQGEVRAKKVLLVDDVYTSGATMKECAKVLRRAGATGVYGLVFAS